MATLKKNLHKRKEKTMLSSLLSASGAEDSAGFACSPQEARSRQSIVISIVSFFMALFYSSKVISPKDRVPSTMLSEKAR